MNLEATDCSTSLDKKLRLDIGRNKSRSSGFGEGFFKRAVTIACFCDAGRTPGSKDVLHLTVMTVHYSHIVSSHVEEL